MAFSTVQYGHIQKEDLLVSNRAVSRAITYYTAYMRVYGQKAASKILLEAIAGVEVVIDALEKDITFNPVRLLGIKMSPGLLYSFAAFIISTLLAMI